MDLPEAVVDAAGDEAVNGVEEIDDAVSQPDR